MFTHQLLAAIASLALVVGVSSEVKAQYHRTGSPGFTRSIYIPSARNRQTRYGDGGDYRNPSYSRRRYHGDQGITIINGGQNCFNCRIDDSNHRRGDRRYSEPRHGNYRR